MSKPLLKARDLHKSYLMGRSPLRVLKGVSLSVKAGEFLAVTGASGSGKSTLLHLLGALDVPDSGTVEFRGEDLFRQGDEARRRYRNRDAGFVFQFYHLLPECTVLENVVMPAMVGCSFWSWRRVRRKVREGARELIDQVGLSERIRHRPAQLSGGERQRVAIARALLVQPALLLADEPTGNLDKAAGRSVLALLTKLNEARQTVVMVTHDPEVAARAHRSVRLVDGVIADQERRGGESTSVEWTTKEVAP